MLPSAATMTDTAFSSQSLGLRAQKKLLGKMSSKKVAKVFIDELTGKVLDDLYHISKGYTGHKKDAEKIMKNIIKIVVKMSILYRNDQFNAEELAVAETFKQKFHTTALTVISFYEVDFSFDKNYMAKLLKECGALLNKMIDRHLTEKSKGRLNHVMNFYTNTEFLETLFLPNGPYRIELGRIVDNLHEMMEAGTI